MDLDFREHRLATARLLAGIAIMQLSAQFLKNRVQAPILFLLSGKDELADTKTSRRFSQSLKVEDKEIILYPEMLHALSIELGRKMVFEDISRWIEKRI
jgi:alpha-beta hydrolase superfamily lysophospholipase